MSKLAFTGERLVPGVFGKIASEHLHRYAITIEIIKGKKVLDIACGEGYGSNLLAEYAEQVTGVDISEEAIFHAAIAYKKENLRFKHGSVLNIPFNEETFDVVVCFETLEHVSNHQKMISELKRVLRPEGILIISTPEKSFYSDQPNYSNPFHEKELYKDEFIELIKSEFEFHQLLYQKYLSGSLILSSQEGRGALRFYSGNFNRFDLEGNLEQEYMVAICSSKELNVQYSDSIFSSEEMNKHLIEEKVSERIKKIKSGFRYRLADFLFNPWDIIKGFIK